MATCGYETVKEFQKAEIMVAPSLQTEGKSLQRSQGIGMGALTGPVGHAHAPSARMAAGDAARAVRHRPGRRLRRPVRPADRPAGARGPRLQRDRAAHDHRGRAAGPAAGGHHPVRRPEVGARRRAPRRSIRPSTTPGSRCSASVTAPSWSPSSSAGTVARTDRGEYGRTALDLTSSAGPPSVIFTEVPPTFDVWMSHVDSITAVPSGFRATASTRRRRRSPPSRTRSRGIYGVQFHPEVVHTHGGQDILKSFLYDVCGCRPAVDHDVGDRGVGRRHPRARSAASG